MSDAARAATTAEVGREKRDLRLVAHETIGSALACLRRLDYRWYDEDVRANITQARSTLSVAQSKLRERIDDQAGPIEVDRRGNLDDATAEVGIEVDLAGDMPPHFRSLTELLWNILRQVATLNPAIAAPKVEA